MVRRCGAAQSLAYDGSCGVGPAERSDAEAEPLRRPDTGLVPPRSYVAAASVALRLCGSGMERKASADYSAVQPGARSRQCGGVSLAPR